MVPTSCAPCFPAKRSETGRETARRHLASAHALGVPREQPRGRPRGQAIRASWCSRRPLGAFQTSLAGGALKPLAAAAPSAGKLRRGGGRVVRVRGGRNGNGCFEGGKGDVGGWDSGAVDGWCIKARRCPRKRREVNGTRLSYQNAVYQLQRRVDARPHFQVCWCWCWCLSRTDIHTYTYILHPPHTIFPRGPKLNR
jgi:hypothetical protein